MRLLEPPFDAMPPDALLGLCLSQACGEIVGIAVVVRRLLVFLQDNLPPVACLKPGEMVLEVGEIAGVWCLLFSVPEVWARDKRWTALEGLDILRALAYLRRTSWRSVGFWWRIQRVGECGWQRQRWFFQEYIVHRAGTEGEEVCLSERSTTERFHQRHIHRHTASPGRLQWAAVNLDQVIV